MAVNYGATHEVAELAADLALVADAIAPPATPAAAAAPLGHPALDGALAAFVAAWQPEPGARAQLRDLADRAVAAGMAVREDDPLTAARLVHADPAHAA